MSVIELYPRLFEVKDVVELDLITALHSIDWYQRSYVRDLHYVEGGSFCRRVLTETCDVQQQVENKITDVVGEIAEKTGIDYLGCGTTWYLCESRYHSPMHTDGEKPNVLILYWIVPGERYGTTFYHSKDPADVMHRFPSIPNTGLFANYEPEPGQIWQGLWHASDDPVPAGSLRLITMSELYR